MRLKLLVGGHGPGAVRLVDAETNELLDMVTKLRWEWSGDDHRVAYLTIEIPNIQIEVDRSGG